MKRRKDFFGIERIFVIQMRKEHIFKGADIGDLVFEDGVVEQFVDLYTGFCILVLIERRDPGFCGTVRFSCETFFLIGILEDVVGHEELDAVGYKDLRLGNASLNNAFDLCHEFPDIKGNAAADNVRGTR